MLDLGTLALASYPIDVSSPERSEGCFVCFSNHPKLSISFDEAVSALKKVAGSYSSFPVVARTGSAFSPILDCSSNFQVRVFGQVASCSIASCDFHEGDAPCELVGVCSGAPPLPFYQFLCWLS